MRVNTAKERMLRGEPAFGYALSFGSPLVAETMSNCGIDFLLMDTQHGSWGPDSTIQALVAMRWGSAMPMARVTSNNYWLIGRLLDEGMMGIVVPIVNTVEDAVAVSFACHYPPLGGRSYAGGRAKIYGDDYFEWIDEQLFVAVQIESKQAAENAEAILAVPGVDGCWIGPADMALSMGFPPSEIARHPEHEQAIQNVLQACRNTGKIPGLACGSVDDALARAAQGFLYLTAAGDTGMLSAAAKAGVQKLNAGRG